uniref:Uncharacterized protein n=2 Tax=Cajanus cajan TaxID=3821 RepID=A0A151SGG2_CAJCA|nr:hypothetical protein KK1_000040 [Cajanus cajan]
MCFSVTNGDEEEERKKASLWEWEKLRTAYPAYSALFSSNIARTFKGLLTHFFRPNIDFRRGNEGQGVRGGEVVKEAVAKSIDTVGDAAKAAAETVHNVKERTLSQNKQTQRQNEL